jgi:uncharacterized membrane protein
VRRANLSRAGQASQARRRQTGSVLVMASVLLLVATVLLLSLDIGYQFYARREVQKVADLAAIAGAQRIDQCSADLASNPYATSIAQSNQFTVGTANAVNKTLAITCGWWDPSYPVTANGNFSTTAIPVGGVTPAMNAVLVTATQVAPLPFLTINTSASAVALRSPIAALSIGTTLVGTNPNSMILGTLFTGLGINLSGTSLLGPNGLAQVNISPASLLKALGVTVPADITVGGLNALLAAQTVTLSTFLNAISTAVGPGILSAVDIATLQSAISATLVAPGIPLKVQLGSTASLPGGVLAPIGGPASASGAVALSAQINALGLLSAGLAVGTAQHALSTGVSIPLALGLGQATVQSAIVEAPSIAIGGVGTTAYTAQVRTYVNVAVNIANITVPLLGNLITLALNLPFVVDVGAAKATITSLCASRDASNRPLAGITATSALVQVCYGTVANGDLTSTSKSCSTNPSIVTPVSPLTASLLGINLLTVPPTTSVTSIAPATASANFYAPQEQLMPATNPLALGTSVSNILNTLLGVALGTPLTAQGTLLGGVSALLTGLFNALQPVFNGLNGIGALILTPLLQNVVGVNLGQTDVTLTMLDCTSDNVKLAN